MGVVGAIMVPHPPLIIPEVGRGEEKQIQETINAYEEAGRFVASLRPDTVVVCSPHSVMYADYFHISPGEKAWGSFAQFRAGMVVVRTDYDRDLVNKICEEADADSFPAGTSGERDRHLDHGTMIPLYFIQKYYTDFKCVRIGISGLPFTDHYRLGQRIQKAAGELERRVVFVGSGDLSHKLKDYGPYGFSAEGPRYDEKIMSTMGRAAFGELLSFDETFCEKAAECGHRSFIMLGGTLDGLSVETHRLSHEDVTGVGYGVCTYKVTGEDDRRFFLRQFESEEAKNLAARRAAEDSYVRLARMTVDSWIKYHVKPVIERGRAVAEKYGNGENRGRKEETETAGTAVHELELPGEMLKRSAGVFVSIHEEGRLRGCIGTISACTDSIAEEIIDNAISASTRDPRFHKIKVSELDRLEITVDVLGAAEPVSSPDQLDVRRYGVIVTKGRRRGLLLPDLEGVDTVEDQIRIAREKAGIGRYERDLKLERFEVVRHY